MISRCYPLMEPCLHSSKTRATIATHLLRDSAQPALWRALRAPFSFLSSRGSWALCAQAHGRYGRPFTLFDHWSSFMCPSGPSFCASFQLLYPCILAYPLDPIPLSPTLPGTRLCFSEVRAPAKYIYQSLMLYHPQAWPYLGSAYGCSILPSCKSYRSLWSRIQGVIDLHRSNTLCRYVVHPYTHYSISSISECI